MAVAGKMRLSSGVQGSSGRPPPLKAVRKAFPVGALTACVGLIFCYTTRHRVLPAAGAGIRGGPAAGGSSDAGGAAPSREQAAEGSSSSAAGTSEGGPLRGAESRGEARSRRTGLFLKLPTFHGSELSEMAPRMKHPCSAQFHSMVQSIPKDAPADQNAARLVDAIRACHVRVVAADFDYTIMDLHTGGSWNTDKIGDLRGRLSSEFVAFGKELNKVKIPLYVVSFADPGDHAPQFGRIGGSELIKAALEVNENPFVVAGIVAMRPDLYSDPSRFRALGLDSPPPRNKSYHVNQVALSSGVEAQDILLVDDDRVNAAQHCKSGRLTLLVRGQGFSFSNIEALVAPCLV